MSYCGEDWGSSFFRIAGKFVPDRAASPPRGPLT